MSCGAPGGVGGGGHVLAGCWGFDGGVEGLLRGGQVEGGDPFVEGGDGGFVT